jgi:molybdopterin converting factor small subunit
MSVSRYSPIRFDSRLRGLIDERRGSVSFSAWVRDACSRRIEAEAGLGPELGQALAAHERQLRGLGTNLNQLARAANEHREVQVNLSMLSEILAEIRASRALLNELSQRLPQ